MTRRRIILPLLAVCAGAGAFASLGAGDGDPYRILLTLDNAGGLRQGSDVAIGGVRVGEVELHFDHADRVVAELNIEREYAPVSRDATAAISAVNLLGAKRVDLVSGPAADNPAPDGFRIAATRVTESTDLDQVLRVLGPQTRTRLAVLISEAGLGFAERKHDLNEVLQTLPPSLRDATTILDELVRDNTTVARLLQRSDRLVAEVTRNRGELKRLVNVGAGAVGTFGSRDRQLRATLSHAPKTLRTLQRFLGELERTTVPLAPAARDIRKVAPELSSLLDQIEPFRQAARPTLATATKAAPSLTRLADGATPVLRRGVPTVRSLARTGAELAPVSRTLDRSSDNILAIVHNWSRAIQFRDAASHVFRGQPSFTSDTLESVLRRLMPAADKKARRKPRERKRPPAPASPSTGERPSAPKLPGPIDKVTDAVGGLLDGLGVPAPKTPSLPKRSDDVSTLLDFLLAP